MNKTITGLALSLCLGSVAACGGSGGDGGDDDGPDGGNSAVDAPAGGGPSTDPTAPTPITAGTPISADYGGDGHYFVFTAPAAGVYTLALAAPPTAQANHCDTTDGCLCNPGGNCCIVGSAETTCTYDVRQFGSGGPLAAGEVVYPTVYMRPGTSAVYTLRIDAR